MSSLHRQYKTARTETRWHLLLKTWQMPTQTSASRGYVLFIGDARNAQKSLNCLPACEHTRGVLKAWKDTDHRRCRMRYGLEMSGFSIRIPLARSIRNSKTIYDLLYKTSPAFFVAAAARLRQICVTSGSAESAGSVCRRAPPRLCPAGAPFLRSWSSACSCSCPARTERNKYFSYS